MTRNKWEKEYLKVKASYTGEGLTRYLDKFYRETKEDFEIRTKTLIYQNYVSPIVESMITPVFTNILRDSSNDITDMFINNVDLKNSHLDDLMKEAMIYKELLGNTFIVINSFDQEQLALSMSDVLAGRTIPYLVHKDMTEMYAYELNDVGQLTGIEFYNKEMSEGYQIIGYNNDIIYTYDVINGEKSNVVAEGNPFPWIPVISFSSDINPFPPFNYISNTCVSIANQLSESRRMERESAFSILELVTDLDVKDVELGSMNIITKPTNASGSSSFISTDPAMISVVRESAKDMIDILFKQAEMLGASVVSGTDQVKSGLALSIEFQGQNYVLKTNSKFAQEVENTLIVAMNIIVPLIKWTSKYPTEFLDPIGKLNSILTSLQSVVNLGVALPKEVTDYISEALVQIVQVK